MKKTKIVTYIFIISVFTIIMLMIMNKHEVNYDYNTHEVNSNEFKNTQVISTLFDNADKNKNIIWCPSFQIAWNELKNYVHEDIKLNISNPTIENLNNSINYKSLLPSNSYYVFNEIINSESINKINNDIYNKFQINLNIPGLKDIQNDSLLLFSFFAMKIKFHLEFNQNTVPLIFNYSNKTCEINSFGILSKDEYDYFDLRKQVKIIYIKGNTKLHTMDDFIVDPGYDESNEIQLILAMTEFKSNLNETVNYVIDKIQNFQSQKNINNEPIQINNDSGIYNIKFHSSDTLLIPNVSFNIIHQFSDINNKVILNKIFNNQPIANAIQIINFNLNKKGAELTTSAYMSFGSRGGHYEFDQPFLIMLKSRHSNVPYFALWIANVELLSKFKK